MLIVQWCPEFFFVLCYFVSISLCRRWFAMCRRQMPRLYGPGLVSIGTRRVYKTTTVWLRRSRDVTFCWFVAAFVIIRCFCMNLLTLHRPSAIRSVRTTNMNPLLLRWLAEAPLVCLLTNVLGLSNVRREEHGSYRNILLLQTWQQTNKTSHLLLLSQAAFLYRRRVPVLTKVPGHTGVASGIGTRQRRVTVGTDRY